MMGNSGSKQDPSCKTKSMKLTNTADFLAAEMEAEQNATLLAQIKERRKIELLAIEEQRLASLAEEIQLSSSSKAQRNQLLNHVTENQKQLEHHIKQIQEKQELNRQKLSEDLYQTELELERSITEILKKTNMHRDPNRLKEMIEAEEKQGQILLALKLEEYRNLRKADVLSAMEEQLKKEMHFFNRPIPPGANLSWMTISDTAQEQEIEKILRDRQKGKEELVSHLIKEEAWQRHAFVHLLSQRDKRSAQIRRDISLVIEQLNQLTSLEMQRKCQKINITSEALGDTRLQLADLLSVLLRQQEQRRQDLTNLLAEMEEQRQNQAADYWLMQYQRLMESAPAFLNISTLSSSSCDASIPPSSIAPPSIPSDSIESSAPPAEGEADAPLAHEVFLETTCVICMDSMSQVIFLTCGHLCCCVKCGDAMDNCPMCRSQIVQRLRVHF